MKKCSKCGLDKPLDAFNKQSSSKDGLQSYCRNCSNLSGSTWRKNNPEYNIKWRKNHPEYKPNPENVCKASNKWRLNNPELSKEVKRNWRKNHPEKSNEENHIRRLRKEENGIFKVTEKFLKRLYLSSCVSCGSIENIEADHIIPISRGGTHSEGNLQPLCQFCNRSKHNKLWIEWKI